MFLLAVTHSVYINMHQPVSETLFILIGFVIMILIASYRNRPSIYYVFLLGLFSAIATLTRFFGLFWMVPIVIGNLWFLQDERSLRARLKHVAAYLSVFSLILSPWILYLKISTGFFSGFDRTSPRELPASIAHWNELTDFVSNVLFLFKTIFFDFFSSHSFASHYVVERKIPLKEYIIFIFVFMLMIMITLTVIHVCMKRPHSIKHIADKIFFSQRALPFQFAAFYIISIVVVWTFTNNDPLYTRFMYPSYIFIILSMFSLYSWMKDQQASIWYKIPFHLIFLVFVSMNLHKILLQITKIDFFRLLLPFV